MERCLSLVIGKKLLLNRENYLVLAGPYDDPRKLDAFVMNRFANSEEVREHFKGVINPYLEKNSYILDKINKEYRGSIVIVEEIPNGLPRRVRVLYSDTREKLQKILADNNFLRHLALDDESPSSKQLKLFSPYIIDSILRRNGQDYTREELKEILFIWKEELKKQTYGTDKLRQLFKKYDEYQKEIRNEKKNKEKQYSLQLKLYD